MTVMSGCRGAPVVSMTVTCVIATSEAAAAAAPANAAANAPHSTTHALKSYSSTAQIDIEPTSGFQFVNSTKGR